VQGVENAWRRDGADVALYGGVLFEESLSKASFWVRRYASEPPADREEVLPRGVVLRANRTPFSASTVSGEIVSEGEGER